MFTWLKDLFSNKSEESAEASDADKPKRKGKGKAHARTHSKRVRERERDLRREWTGQKGGWKKFYSKGGYVGVC